ncbi:hypothetical protein EGR_04523 [Echinococcus granulosus]|uniref:Uncharacterized protein n=1 Tax=Echinococcus granulosus TaxID=6210 RepID=W6UGP4_ECHGR|nr:hypothetical protein EGR_04523 [Echinococcus granulosus]EUB60690.1 hypothetical protein EGR_04523 [Echinococcus granulosus]
MICSIFAFYITKIAETLRRIRCIFDYIIFKEDFIPYHRFNTTNQIIPLTILIRFSSFKKEMDLGKIAQLLHRCVLRQSKEPYRHFLWYYSLLPIASAEKSAFLPLVFPVLSVMAWMKNEWFYGNKVNNGIGCLKKPRRLKLWQNQTSTNPVHSLPICCKEGQENLCNKKFNRKKHEQNLDYDFYF